MPREINLGEIYLPPTLVVGTMALALAWLTVTLLNRYRLSRFFAAPTLVFFAITAIYAVIIGTHLIPV